MRAAQVNAYGSRGLTLILELCLAVIFALEGWSSGASGTARVLPWMATMLLSTLDQTALGLGRDSFAYPVTRAQWVASRVQGILRPVLLGALAWGGGAWIAGALGGQAGAPAHLEGPICALALYLGFALGPYLWNLMTSVQASSMDGFRPLTVVPYLVLAFVPWGTLGQGVASWGPLAVGLALGASLVFAVAGPWVTTGWVQRRDAPG